MDWRLESRHDPQAGMPALRSAAFPGCGFTGLSSPVFTDSARTAGVRQSFIVGWKPLPRIDGNLNMRLTSSLQKICIAGILFCAILFAFGGKPVLADDAVSSTRERKTVVILGDSLAAGYGLDPSEAFPALLQKKIDDAKLNFTVINAGVSGDTSAGGLRRIDWLLKRKVDVLVLELGGNDGLRGIDLAATRANLQGIIDRMRQKYPQAQIVIAGMQMPPNLGEDYTRGFRELYPELAKTNHAALIPFLLEGVGGHPELNQPDHIHPTAEGDKIVAENVWKVLRPVLEKMGSQNN
jgi:acyl-CoA thioesterase-1